MSEPLPPMLAASAPASEIFGFGDMLLCIVLGLTFPYVEDVIDLRDTAGAGVALAHGLLYLLCVVSTIGYWRVAKRWAAQLPPSFAAPDHLVVAVFALFFYLGIRYSTRRDLAPFLMIWVLQGFLSLVGDLWFTFGLVRRAAEGSPVARAIYRLQSSPRYLLRGALLPVAFLALAALHRYGTRAIAEVPLTLAIAVLLSAILVANDAVLARWRAAALGG